MTDPNLLVGDVQAIQGLKAALTRNGSWIIEYPGLKLIPDRAAQSIACWLGFYTATVLGQRQCGYEIYTHICASEGMRGWSPEELRLKFYYT